MGKEDDMEKPFFIMTYFNNSAVPMGDEKDDMAFFRTIEEARAIAENHPFCQAYGYEIFEMGTGD